MGQRSVEAARRHPDVSVLIEHELAEAAMFALNDGARWVMDGHSRQSFSQRIAGQRQLASSCSPTPRRPPAN